MAVLCAPMPHPSRMIRSAFLAILRVILLVVVVCNIVKALAAKPFTALEVEVEKNYHREGDAYDSEIIKCGAAPRGIFVPAYGGHDGQIDQQNQLYKKIRKLKYLQDQLLIKTDTNLMQVLEERSPLWTESRQYNKTRLSLEMLRENEQVVKLLRRMAERNGIQKTTRAEAEPLTEEDLQEHIQQLEEVDSTEVWNAFLASSYDLFKFILRYDYKVKCTMEDLVTLFCQLVILHSDECRMTGEYAIYQDIEYPIIYAK